MEATFEMVCKGARGTTGTGMETASIRILFYQNEDKTRNVR